MIRGISISKPASMFLQGVGLEMVATTIFCFLTNDSVSELNYCCTWWGARRISGDQTRISDRHDCFLPLR